MGSLSKVLHPKGLRTSKPTNQQQIANWRVPDYDFLFALQSMTGWSPHNLQAITFQAPVENLPKIFGGNALYNGEITKVEFENDFYYSIM